MKTPLDGLADTIEREIGLGRASAPAPLTDEELAEVLIACDRYPRGVHGTETDEIAWRRLRALAIEARDARSGVR